VRQEDEEAPSEASNAGLAQGKDLMGFTEKETFDIWHRMDRNKMPHAQFEEKYDRMMWAYFNKLAKTRFNKSIMSYDAAVRSRMLQTIEDNARHGLGLFDLSHNRPGDIPYPPPEDDDSDEDDSDDNGGGGNYVYSGTGPSKRRIGTYRSGRGAGGSAGPFAGGSSSAHAARNGSLRPAGNGAVRRTANKKRVAILDDITSD